MKKGLSICIIIILFSTMLFAAERVWYMDSDKFSNRINLANTFYLPTYALAYSQNESLGSAEKGTYSIINTVGNFGVYECDHRIEFFIETDGRFVSQSDTTKYREFYIALRPRVQYNNADNNYNLGSNGIDINTADRLPNTKTNGGVLNYIAPAVPAGGSYIRVDPTGTMKTVTRFHSDLVLCMDELTAQDRQHLAETDDYVGGITLGWRCAEDNCTNPKHKGSFRVILLGYFGTDAPNASHVTMFVNPDPGSTSLNISDIVRTKGGEATVAELKIYATSTKSTKWSEKLFTFLSASQSYTDDTKSFVLTNNRNGKTIGYSVSVYDDKGALVKTFTGNTKYTGKMSNCKDLTPYQKNIPNREGTAAYSVVFEGTVKIKLNLTAAQLDADNPTPLDYPGMYTSNIYYHIVTNGNTI